MKPSTTFALLPLAFCVLFSACESIPPGNGEEYAMTLNQPRKEKFGYQGTDSPDGSGQGANANVNSGDGSNISRRNPDDPNSMAGNGTDPNGIVKPKPPEEPDVDPDPVQPDPDPVTPDKPTSKNYPMAELVPGQSGVVYSPYVTGKKVSIEGFKPGDLAECPWTGKPFRVP